MQLVFKTSLVFSMLCAVVKVRCRSSRLSEFLRTLKTIQISRMTVLSVEQLRCSLRALRAFLHASVLSNFRAIDLWIQASGSPSALLPRKEVIQPHLPIRLPCYDFTPVIDLTLGCWLLSVTSQLSGAINSHGVTGGVYKARERIHRGMLIRDY